MSLCSYNNVLLLPFSSYRERQTFFRVVTRLKHLSFLAKMLRFGALGADHLTLEGGWGEGDFEKSFLQTLIGRKKLHAAQME